MALKRLPVSDFNATPAAFGTLDREVARDLGMLREFVVVRERRMRRLFGRSVRRSATRDELMRIILLAFADGQTLRVSSCIQLCGAYATAPTVRGELALMAASGLVILNDDGGNRSASLLPTVKLIDFYNVEIPKLREAFLELLLTAYPRRTDEGPASE